MIEPVGHAYWIASSGAEGCAGAVEARFPFWIFTTTAIAICALKLAEEGALRLDAPPDGHLFSVRLLLGHTSGLPDYGRL